MMNTTTPDVCFPIFTIELMCNDTWSYPRYSWQRLLLVPHHSLVIAPTPTNNPDEFRDSSLTATKKRPTNNMMCRSSQQERDSHEEPNRNNINRVPGVSIELILLPLSKNYYPTITILPINIMKKWTPFLPFDKINTKTLYDLSLYNFLLLPFFTAKHSTN